MPPASGNFRNIRRSSVQLFWPVGAPLTRSLTLFMLGLLASTASAQTVLDLNKSHWSAPTTPRHLPRSLDNTILSNVTNTATNHLWRWRRWWLSQRNQWPSQYNAFGSFGGFTVGGDGTLNTTTGALTVTKTNGTSFSALATTTPGTGWQRRSASIPARQAHLL